MIEEFKKYVNKYNLSDEKIANKVGHSLRVMTKNKEYAIKLGFTEEEIISAEEIGLLHDIGRFEQLKLTNSFNDLTGYDHAEMGVNYLFKEGNISKYVNDKSHYNIIEFAIKYHNKYELPICSNERMQRQAKLIRDTDKLDILYLVGYLKEYNFKADNSEISPLVRESIYNHKVVSNKDVITNNDKIAVKFALVFDINYDIFLEEIKDNVTAYYKQIEGEYIFKDVYNEIIKYLNERIDKKC